MCGTGAAGVYDIAMHYQYEDGRGVAELSTMKRAMQGFQGFASQSPAIILNKAAGRDPQKQAEQNDTVSNSQDATESVLREHSEVPLVQDQAVAAAGKRYAQCLMLQYQC